jgi:SNF2 family DNA or RNA helicase
MVAFACVDVSERQTGDRDDAKPEMESVTVDGYEFKSRPFNHQLDLWKKTRDEYSFGLLWEQGTGKTKVAIDTAAWLYERGEIDGVVVIAPNGVHLNWEREELKRHLPDRVAEVSSLFAWHSSKSGQKRFRENYMKAVSGVGLSWLFMAYPATITDRGKKALTAWLTRRRCLIIFDESHRIKTPGAKRTKFLISAAKKAAYRRILTGTIGDKPFDVYSQIKALENDFWKYFGLDTFHGFQNYFGIFENRHTFNGGRAQEFKQLLEYRRLDELAHYISPITDRKLKTDVLDLPEKLYQKRFFEMTPKQSKVYRQLRDAMFYELDNGQVIDGTLAIVRMLRLQQVACGYMPNLMEDHFTFEPVDDKSNPRLETLAELCENVEGQAIIWARFRQDINLICNQLGNQAARYDGTLKEEDAFENKEAFVRGDKKFFVATPSKGSEGLTLANASTVIFYSNSFKLLERLQAEDRAHRIGQVNHVNYVDLAAVDTIDEKIITALRQKFDLASQVTGDNLRDWI